MLQELENLRVLQKIDNQIFDIENFLAVVPGNILKLQEEFDTKNQKFEELSTLLVQTKEEKLKSEKEYEEKKKLLTNAQKKLSTVKNNKEYEAVLKELDTLKKEINTLEYKVLELSDNLENLTKQTEDLKGELAKIEEELNKLKQEKNEADKDKIEQLTKLKEERQIAASSIKRQYLSKYETIRKVRNNLAIVRVEQETCTGCYMKIPPQLYVEVKKNTSIQQCPNCQRFLYFLEESE